MKGWNIMLAGVGGQGLVLTTSIICSAAFAAGYDVKSNDVIGLSQRGGKVWGSVKMAEKVYSPNISPGEADVLVALEPLEADRWKGCLRKDGIIIVNTGEIPPAHVTSEKIEYPPDIIKRLSESFKVHEIDAAQEGKRLGSAKVANTFLIGILARYLELPMEAWQEAISANVPAGFLDMNIKAFDVGYELQSLQGPTQAGK